MPAMERRADTEESRMTKPHLTVLSHLAAALLAGASLLACSADPSDAFDGDDALEPSKSDPSSTDDGPVCLTGKDYAGFGGKKLGASERTEAVAGADRARIKPLSALRSEYVRLLGAEPETLKSQEQSIGRPQSRWFVEPEANAVAIYSLYAVAFDGCYAFMKTGPFAEAPTAETAPAQCKSLGRKFWSRTLTDEETATCAELVLSGLPGSTTPSRRWAHTCATLLTSAGFLSY